MQKLVMDRPTAPPAWLVVASFAPTAILLWLIGLSIIPLEREGVRLVFQAISLAQLFIAFILQEQFPAGDDGRNDSLATGLVLAAGVLLIAELARFATAQLGWGRPNSIPALLLLLAQQVVMIALAEELWFRGLWMRAMAGRPGCAIFGGAAGFGLYHLHQGWELMLTSAALGVLFGTARWYGAPIWALALAHGLFNWINSNIIPGVAWRSDPLTARLLYVGLLLLGAWVLQAFARSRSKDRRLRAEDATLSTSSS
ncbi:CPBP family intramembrane glutamic endopeptidase [Bradyrhizobium sp. LHD-71]|uniref:CPBP family intramembrane glutamic endopeptidase n=1 Tax=Bradyrhizobium sp. LHD-71 TaxID=3072141 RepID=UPI00280CC16A|nr:CPBP family intramembrane glutamic endopeptidase [Bradyrhizobium sp. LHD-71]MDQ8731943.1 CPBP family intramembrane glutamic endopeptidase [Bradyrhizobium sp. LHD-71]